MKATKVGRDTALAQIIKVVEDAQGSKAPIQRLADKISGIFVPIVVGIAIVTFLVWIIWVTPGEFTPALEVLIAILVIACPCALGLATPTSIMAGSGRAAEFGILFKGGEHLEQTQRIDTVVVDKTGTVTHGKPVLTDVLLSKRSRRRKFLSLNRCSGETIGAPISGSNCAWYSRTKGLNLEMSNFSKRFQVTVSKQQSRVKVLSLVHVN